MIQTDITPANSVFVLLSFEGPDRYSLAGGLGVRATNLGETLAQKGFPTHLFFIGDPQKTGEEHFAGSRLVFHRWCQWISEYYPLGVYQGENEKVRDYTASIPDWTIRNIIRPAVGSGRVAVVLAEEWHTTGAVIRLHEELLRAGLRDRVIIFWNANNTFGFDRVDWKRLAAVATITTVSRYMKHIMWGLGVNPLVIPNGIPKSMLDPVDASDSAALRKTIDAGLLISKVARFDPDKCWNMAVEGTTILKDKGEDAVLFADGGIEKHGIEVLSRARTLGLNVKDVDTSGELLEDYLSAVSNRAGADLLNIRFHCPQSFLRIVYNASDAVLANSRHEPFGLVGLETMAAGGVAFIGSTGEDYAVPFRNSIVLDTADPREIEANLMYLKHYPEESEKIRRAARQTARDFTWDRIIENLLHKLEYKAIDQGIIAASNRVASAKRDDTDLNQYFGGTNSRQ